MDGKSSRRVGWTTWVVAAVVALGLSGCAGWNPLSWGRSTPVPDEPGLYALVDAPARPSLQRLDGHKQWEIETWGRRSQLDSGVAFVIRHPELAQPGQPLERLIHLRRVSWVRSAINARGEILPVEGSRWAVPDLAVFEVPLRLERVEGNAEVVRATPLAPLEAGLYSLELEAGVTPTRARVGVQWPNVDQRSYSAATCVDRYEGAGPRYRPCAEQSQQAQVPAAPQWLRLYLVDPELRPGAQGQALVIKGVVVNTSAEERARVPPLEAQVRSANGVVLQRWRFDPGIDNLAPSESASFRTEPRATPPGAHSVHVQFAPS